MELAFFSLVAVTAVISGIMVITCRSPINSALSLVLTFFCLATFYVMLDAPFMAAIQVMVYAGAIMVLIIFVIMLLNLRTEVSRASNHALVIGSVLGVAVLLELFVLISRGTLTGFKGMITPQLVERLGHTELIGAALYTDFLLPFEVTSILLLAAIVGAVVLAKKKI